jgi:hypothetical protein
MKLKRWKRPIDRWSTVRKSFSFFPSLSLSLSLFLHKVRGVIVTWFVECGVKYLESTDVIGRIFAVRLSGSLVLPLRS